MRSQAGFARRRRAAPAGTATLRRRRDPRAGRGQARARGSASTRFEGPRASAEVRGHPWGAMPWATHPPREQRIGPVVQRTRRQRQCNGERLGRRERRLLQSRSAAAGQNDRLPVGCRRDPHEHYATGRGCEQRLAHPRGQRRSWRGTMKLLSERRSGTVAPHWRSESGGAARDRLVAPVEDRTRGPRP
jgi:hypothetical protein